MILTLLLTELVRLDVRLVAEGERVRVQARAGTLSEELRQALAEHKADLLRFARTHSVETIDGPGRLTGHRQEQDVSCISYTRNRERSANRRVFSALRRRGI